MAELCSNEPGTRARWGIIESGVLFDLRLSIGARYVYAAIAGSVNARGETEFCQATFAAKAGRSRPWLNAALLELEQAGLLWVERIFADGLQRANRYILTDRLERGGRKGRDADPVGETPFEIDVDARPEDLPSHLGEATGTACQSAVVSDQPADSAGRSTASAVRSADTNHDSDSHISLSTTRERAGPDTGNGREGGLERTPIPVDWAPNADDLTWAGRACPGLDVPAFTERFILACRAKLYLYADYHAAWRQWILDPKSPLPLLAPKVAGPVVPSGETDHVQCSFSASARPSGPCPHPSQKIFRDRWGSGRKTFNAGNFRVPASGSGNLAAANASRAHAVLERLLVRRADSPLA
jgi:hypothetical protein